MISGFRFANYHLLYVVVPLILLVAFIRLFWAYNARYVYPLGSFLRANGYTSSHPYKKILYCVRLALLLVLALLIARPQTVDQYSKVSYKGIDIMMILDVSGSMFNPVDINGMKSRIEVVKEEALRFIDQRVNDAIGVIVFGHDVLVRCPITHDKRVLRDIVKQIDVGMIDPDGTFLATSLVTGVSRLKHAKAASKMIILMSDGDPTEGDMNPDMAIQVAQKMGIKVYTVGIVNAFVRYPRTPIIIPVGEAQRGVSHDLLKRIAKETGGKFFSAEDQSDMRAVYDSINELEKTEREEPVFAHYNDFFEPGVLFASIMFVVEIILSSLVWFGI